MCLPPPITDNSYGHHKAAIAAAATKEARDSCKQAAADLHRPEGKPVDECIGVKVTWDGRWATCGFTSQFGVVIMSFETGKILDLEVMSKYC